jgi:mannose-1-phosphate guanylyltransferase/mannose-6-phosphate isomerase
MYGVGMIVPIILSGGSGTRLWPLSRPARPKQLLAMLGAETMLRATLDRLEGLEDVAEPFVVCNAGHHHLVAAELESAGHGTDRIVLEPVGRNTAPAVAAAAHLVADDAALLLVLPADHVITDRGAFAAAVRLGESYASEGSLVTFGIVPGYPETGYGYIRMGQELGDSVRRVDSFVEKPDVDTARSYVADGDHVWNSGMFLFSAGTYLEELRQHSPDIAEAATQAVAFATRSDGVHLDEDAFAGSPSDSIDYAVMEHTHRAVVVPLDAGWSDVGSWSAMWELSDRDGAGNVTIGDVVTIGTSGSYVRSDGKLVAVVGLEGVAVVDTPDALLVAALDDSQDVKAVVEQLRLDGRPEADTSTREVRPWGSFEVLGRGPGFQVKRLVLTPGRRLSLQRHRHRAEKWTVTSGRGVVTVDNDLLPVAEGDMVSIGVGSVHRVENDGDVALQIVEVQLGDYLGEDDIERLEDDFGRS